MPEYADVQTFIVVLFALFAAIIVIDKIVDIFKKYRAPGLDMEGEMDKIKDWLDNDNKRITALEESSRLTLRGINALIESILLGDGEDNGKLESVKHDITEYLINRS